MEPFPEGERNVRQRLLRELIPAYGAFVVFELESRNFRRQISQILAVQPPASIRSELIAQHLAQLGPAHLVRHIVEQLVLSGERIMPGNGGPGVRVLVSVHYHDNR